MIGEPLPALRKDANLTQDELASILNINKHFISSYEQDKSKPPDAIKIAIAQYFHVSVDYFLGLSDIPSADPSVSQILRLPSGFPEEEKQELLNYAQYLIYRRQSK